MSSQKPKSGRGGKATPTTRSSIAGGSGSRPDMQPSTSQAGSSRAMVPAGSRAMAPPGRGRGRGRGQRETILAPKGYTMRPVEPAKNYDVISFARAMNDDMGPRVKKLFDCEREAALEAIKTGIYMSWRCPEFTWDCQRVNKVSKCFCSHMLQEHAPFHPKSNGRLPCRSGSCNCKAFAWVPTRPEEVGEFWFQRRRNFDPSTWRAKCKCKHTHEEHDPTGLHRCRVSGCGCSVFDSAFLCAACDKHWELHETFFETEAERRQRGMPVGEDHLPFAEIPQLRNMVLTGEDDGDMSYMKVMHPPGMEPIESSHGSADNSTVVPFGGRGKSSFKPVYD